MSLEQNSERSLLFKAVAISLFAAVALICVLSFIFEFNDYHMNDARTGDFYACDFHMRMNEATCARQGVNPYAVWNLEVERMPYVPNVHHELWTPERCEFINAYTPWAYTLMMPLSFLPRTIAWRIYYVFVCCCVCLIGFLGYEKGYRLHRKVDEGLFVAAFSLSILYGVNYDLLAGNFCSIVTLAVLGMAYSLQRGWNVTAGVLWAVAMLKPQMSVFLAIPLCCKLKFRTCFVAAALCLSLAVVPSYLCDVSLYDLIRQGPLGCANGFKGCGILPRNVYLWLIGNDVDSSLVIGLASICGLLTCCVLTWMLRAKNDWIALFVPAVLCSVTCNYANGYNFCICSVLLISMAMVIISYREWETAFLWLIVPVVFSIRAFDMVNYVVGQKHELLSRLGVWTWGPIPNEIGVVIGTWWSFGLFVCGVFYCLWLSRCHLK